ncbi:MAG TPA: FAD-dependent monooxygenase [Hanamia sp.]|nr:FAD-dependent monooxygenase [Hanamia sp.]
MGNKTNIQNDLPSSNSFLNTADVVVVGGGLAGLSLSILLSRSGYKTVLFEKEKYPFHKVCGEYISMESWNFIEDLGLNLSRLHLPIIQKLIVSAPDGSFLNTPLDPGGFGISRFFLDNELKNIAIENGAIIYDDTKVSDVLFKEDGFIVAFNGGRIATPVVAAAFGKRSNLDARWKRNFMLRKPGKLNNYIGVKYHIKGNFSEDTIALHNFKDGYCGISKIENECYCLCYLTTAKNLKENNNSIKKMEQKVLYKNPILKKIFLESSFLFSAPVTISQISFDKKMQVENHILMLGDAAGMITPLCGNGMSMALHSAKIAFENIQSFLDKKISRDEMEKQYVHQWQRQFASRLSTGRFIQKLFGRELITNLFIKIIKYFPFIIRKMIRQTHGKQF